MRTAERPPDRKKQGGVRSWGELNLIRLIQRRAEKATLGLPGAVRFGIGDDCAILRPRGNEDLVVTTDLSLEGRHFRKDWHSAQSIGHRTLARGLSDLAAMGARPLAAFLSLALPETMARDKQWLRGFLDGFLDLAQRAPVPLAGGDTAQAPADHVIADIVLLGAVPRGKALRRDKARKGDRIFITGALGGAAAQLAELTAGKMPYGSGLRRAEPNQPHFFPEPRLQTGQKLLKRALAEAAIDISDGLSTDLRHLCQQSQVSAELDVSRLPLHPLLSRLTKQESLRLALHGGEDYELLFTAPKNASIPRSIGGVTTTEIGRIIASGRRPSITLVHDGGRRTALAAQGWEHFR